MSYITVRSRTIAFLEHEVHFGFMRNALMAFLKSTFVTLLFAMVFGCSLFSRKAEPIRNDAALRDQVENALSRDAGLKGAQISVHCLRGVIDLTGSVKSSAVKARAGLVAASTPGVVQVHNDLLTPASGGG